MRLRSSPGRVPGPGSARSGYEHWWHQRLSAAALIPLGLWFAFSLLNFTQLDYATVAIWAAQPWHAILLILLLVALLFHSNLGLQVVVDDYVHDATTRAVSLALLKYLHILLAVAAIYALIYIYFGARP